MFPNVDLPQGGAEPGDDPLDPDAPAGAEAADEPFRIELDPDVETPADSIYRDHLQNHWGF